MLFLEEKFKDYLTPYKYGKPVLAPSGVEGEFDRFGVDNLRIVSHGGKFYMFYIGFDGTGYRTALAVSDDLLHWEEIQRISIEGEAECPDIFPLCADGDPKKRKWIISGASHIYIVCEYKGGRFSKFRRRGG